MSHGLVRADFSRHAQPPNTNIVFAFTDLLLL